MDSNIERSIRIYPMSIQESLQEAIDLQQNLYELSSDWNFYEQDQHDYLQKNIRYAIFGADDKVAKLDSSNDKYTGEEKIIDTVYKRILEASRSKKSLYVGIIFNVLCSINKSEKFVLPVPIFSVKRCKEGENRSSAGQCQKKIGKTALHSCCVYYIDLEGRIYKTWTDYVTNNILPKCLMVLPMGGLYQANPYLNNTAEKTFVWVEVGPSPISRKITPYLDNVSTFLGLGALSIGVTALAAPAMLAAPVLMIGSACSVVSGVYTTLRSGQQLFDRHKHQQSMNMKDKSARSAWFGIVGGVASSLASGSTCLLSKAAKAGLTLGRGTQSTHNVIIIGNIMVNGAGIGNGVYNILQNFRENEEISSLELGQLMAHILFFGNTLMNFKTAETVIIDTQQQVLQDYENSLRSNRHKKEFRRIRRNTQASNTDSVAGDSQIIRGIRSIANKDDFFAWIVRNKKVFSRANAEVIFKDGDAMIIGNMKFDPIELSQQPKEMRINTVRAAEPLNRPLNSTSSSFSRRMAVSAYNKEVNSAKELIESLPSFGDISMICYVAKYVGGLVIELQEFTKNHRDSIISGLAKIALRIIKENRDNVKRAIDGLMYYIWKAYVQPEVDKQLRFFKLDTTNIAGMPAPAKRVYTIIQRKIDELYDGIEFFLEEIIEAYSRSSLTSQLAICDVCLGYPLSDKD